MDEFDTILLRALDRFGGKAGELGSVGTPAVRLPVLAGGDCGEPPSGERGLGVRLRAGFDGSRRGVGERKGGDLERSRAALRLAAGTLAGWSWESSP